MTLTRSVRRAARTAGQRRRRSVLAASLVLSVLGAAAAVMAAAREGKVAPTAAAVAPAAPAAPAAGQAHGAQAVAATATLASADDPKLSGTVIFTQLADAVRVEVNVAGVDLPGPHGIHLHEKGACEADGAGKRYTSAGGHFNPGGAPHACREMTAHHAGDFGNIEIQADGSGHLAVVTAALSLHGPNSPIGKSVVLHAGEDDCKTQPAGNSGARLACGVVVAAGGTAH
jgi:Cu-Zn family superoxide dismutase